MFEQRLVAAILLLLLDCLWAIVHGSAELREGGLCRSVDRFCPTAEALGLPQQALSELQVLIRCPEPNHKVALALVALKPDTRSSLEERLVDGQGGFKQDEQHALALTSTSDFTQTIPNRAGLDVVPELDETLPGRCRSSGFAAWAKI